MFTGVGQVLSLCRSEIFLILPLEMCKEEQNTVKGLKLTVVHKINCVISYTGKTSAKQRS